MFPDPRILIFFGANALLLFLAQLVNSGTSAWPCHFFLLGPMVVLPTLYLRQYSHQICSLLSGLWVDASMGVPFGLFATLFLFAGTGLYLMRSRFRAEHNYHPVLLAQVVNLFLLAGLTLVAGRGQFHVPSFWIHLAATLICSQAVLILVGPWFFNLERQLLEIFQLDSKPEEMPLS